MTIKPIEQYPTQTDGADPAFPHGKALNDNEPGNGTGFPLEKAWVNDVLGSQQALLAEAEVEPSGTPDQVGASDTLDALKVVAGQSGVDRARKFELNAAIFTQRSLPITMSADSTLSIAFSEDGRRLYAFTTEFANSASVQQFDLSNPYEVDSVVGLPGSSVFAPRLYSPSFVLADNDTRAYFVAQGASAVEAEILQFSLFNQGDIRIVIQVGQLTVPLLGRAARVRMAWSQDGRKMFLNCVSGATSGAAERSITEFEATAPFQVSSAVATGVVRNTLPDGGQPRFGLDFSPDGLSLVVGGSGDSPVQYTLSEPFEIATLRARGSVNLDIPGGRLRSVLWARTGRKLFGVGRLSADPAEDLENIVYQLDTFAIY